MFTDCLRNIHVTLGFPNTATHRQATQKTHYKMSRYQAVYMVRFQIPKHVTTVAMRFWLSSAIKCLNCDEPVLFMLEGNI